MDTRSDFADADRHSLTFDIPDDALEGAAGAELAFTWVHCTSPLGLGVSCGGRRSIGVMTGRTNWKRIQQRRLMRRQGVEDVKGGTPIVTTPANKQPRRRLSKAELREQAAAAFLAWRAGQTSKDK
jgi:hypothetical protein